ncbi:membrane protein [Pseudoclavibacter endophyticus]|uniref:DMT family transporter n=1 Tax=Pseudoclavibacter endophyticus TaxID=1778590 RepID=UPI0016630897|nr:DMT family transporter [Pseudoclavibacter endophyticus]GGA71800.1 membrane protein [Pseudoclavibacter endophyticus]
MTTDDAAAERSRRASRLAWAGIALGVLSSICYATVNALLRSIAGEVDPFVGAMVRQLPLLAALVVGALVLRPVALNPARAEFIGPRAAAALFVTGIVALFIGNAILFYALDWVGLGISTAGYLGGLLLGSGLISWVFLNERPKPLEFVGMGAIALGLWLTSQAAPPMGDQAWVAVVGFLLAVVTGVCYSISNAVSRSSQRTPGRFIATLGLITLGAVVSVFVFLLIRDGFDLTVTFGTVTGFQLAVLLLAGLVNGAALVSITVAVHHATVTTVSMLNSLVLVFGIVFGFLFFDEPVTLFLAAGSLCILAGVIIGQLRFRRGTPTVGPPA